MGAYKNLMIELEEAGFYYSHFLFDVYVEALKEKGLFDPDLPMDQYPTLDLDKDVISTEAFLAYCQHKSQRQFVPIVTSET